MIYQSFATAQQSSEIKVSSLIVYPRQLRLRQYKKYLIIYIAAKTKNKDEPGKNSFNYTGLTCCGHRGSKGPHANFTTEFFKKKQFCRFIFHARTYLIHFTCFV